eukprot:gene1884-2061_t
MGFINFAHFVDLCGQEANSIDQKIVFRWDALTNPALPPWIIVDWNNVVMKLCIEAGGDMVALSIRAQAVLRALFTSGGRLCIYKDGAHDLNRLILKFDRALRVLDDDLERDPQQSQSVHPAKPLPSARLAMQLVNQIALRVLHEVFGSDLPTDLSSSPDAPCIFQEVQGEADGAIRSFARDRLREGQRDVIILSDDHSLLLDLPAERLFFLRPGTLCLQLVESKEECSAAVPVPVSVEEANEVNVESREEEGEGVPVAIASGDGEDADIAPNDVTLEEPAAESTVSISDEKNQMECERVLVGIAVSITDFLRALTQAANRVCKADINKRHYNHIPISYEMMVWISALFTGDLRGFRSRSFEDPSHLVSFLEKYFDINRVSYHKGRAVVAAAILVRSWWVKGHKGDDITNRTFSTAISEVVKAAGKINRGQVASIFDIHSCNMDDKFLRDAASKLLYAFESSVPKERIQGKFVKDSLVWVNYPRRLGDRFKAKIIFVNTKDNTAGVVYDDPGRAGDEIPCALSNLEVQNAMSWQIEKAMREITDEVNSESSEYKMFWGLWCKYEPIYGSTELQISPLYSLAYQYRYLSLLDEEAKARLTGNALLNSTQASNEESGSSKEDSVNLFFRSLHGFFLDGKYNAIKSVKLLHGKQRQPLSLSIDDLYQRYVKDNASLPQRGSFEIQHTASSAYLEWEVLHPGDDWALDHGLCLPHALYSKPTRGALFNLEDRLAFFKQLLRQDGLSLQMDCIALADSASISRVRRTDVLFDLLQLKEHAALRNVRSRIAALLSKLPGSENAKSFIYSLVSCDEVADLIFATLLYAFKLQLCSPREAIPIICSLLFSPVFAALSFDAIVKGKVTAFANQYQFEKSLRDFHRSLFGKNYISMNNSDRHASLLELTLSPLLRISFPKYEVERAAFFHLGGVQGVLGRLESVPSDQLQSQARALMVDLKFSEEIEREFNEVVGVTFSTLKSILLSA